MYEFEMESLWRRQSLESLYQLGIIHFRKATQAFWTAAKIWTKPILESNRSRAALTRTSKTQSVRPRAVLDCGGLEIAPQAS